MTEPQRRADWFELFFDLVFVVTVAVLAHGLHGDPGWSQYATFLFLFFPAWWAWVNLMISVNLFGFNATWNRIVLIAAMPGLGLMAASAPEGLGEHAWAYALGAAWIQGAVFALWWPQVGGDLRIPPWRPIVYSVVPGVVWLVSAVVPSPERFVLWFVAIAIEVALLSIRSGQSREIDRRVAVDHLVERIGLFVVIVFGELVFTIVIGLSEHFTALSGLAALGAFATVVVLGVIFFQYGTASAELGIARAQLRDSRGGLREAVLYVPFFFICGITMLAAALGTAVAEPTHHLPPGSIAGLVGGLVIYYALSAVFEWRLGQTWRAVLPWLAPGVVAPLIVVLPLAFVLPAWASALATGTVALGLWINDAFIVEHPSAE